MAIESIREYSEIRNKPYLKEFTSREYLLSSDFSSRITKIIDVIGNFIFKAFIKERNINNPEKILIIKNDFIGDLVLATPFIAELRKQFPKSEITLGIRSFSKVILEGNKDYDKILEMNTPWLSRNDSKGLIGLAKLKIKNFRKYDLVYELTADPRNVMLSFALGKQRIGFTNRGFGFLLNKKIKRDLKNHIVDENLKLLPKKSSKIIYDLSYLIDIKIAKKLDIKNSIIIHPGVSEKSRDWGINNFIKLAQELSKKHKVIIVERDEKILKKFKKIKNIKVINTKTLNELASVISRAKLLIGLESLSIHLASALKIKTLDIHSSTTPFWIMGPYNKNKTILFNNEKCLHCEELFCNQNFAIQKIPVEAVKNAAEKMMNK